MKTGKRIALAAVPLLLVVGIGTWFVLSPHPDDKRGPEQPVAFYHSVHAGQLQMPCMYCHYSAASSKSAGIPSVQLCVGCHVPGSQNTAPQQASLAFPVVPQDSNAPNYQIKKEWRGYAEVLLNYWKNGQPIPWVKIHDIPDHAQFPHSSHIRVGLKCQTCHGPVQKMKVVYQYSSLRMGWCVSCHRGQVELSAEETESIRARSGYLRKMAALRAQGTDTRAMNFTDPKQWASVDCTVCHY